MTVAILGGRFDPPHWGHWWVSRQVIEKRSEIDQVWFMPAAKHQWKPIIASKSDRLAMLRFFASAYLAGKEGENRKILVSNIELARGGISYSVDTVREIKKRFGYKVYWIIGSDIIKEFSRWERVEDLLKLATFLVFPRDPRLIPEELPAGFEVVTGKDLITTNLSSTFVRQRIKEGKSIHGFVPEGVEEYIKNKGLYKKIANV